MLHLMSQVGQQHHRKVIYLSYWTFLVWWILLLHVHVITCIFNIVYAYVYWNLSGTYLDLCLEFYQIGMPNSDYHKIAIVHTVMAAMHGGCLLFMVGGSLYQQSLAFTPWSTSTAGRNRTPLRSSQSTVMQRVLFVYTKMMYPCTLCGVNGKYFDVALICREMIETALQTVQAYRMSLLLPRTLLNRFYVLLLAVNCSSSIVAEIVFSGRDEARRRFWCLLLDCMLDLMSSIGVALIVLASYVEYYNPDLQGFDDSIWYDDVWVARALNELKMVVVVSWSDLMSRLIFTMGLVITTTNLKRVLWQLPRNVTHVAPSVTSIVIATTVTKKLVKSDNDWIGRRRQGSRDESDQSRSERSFLVRVNQKRLEMCGDRCIFRTIYLLFGVWGIVVLGLHIHASIQPALPQCFLQVRPWIYVRPSCYLVGLDCHSLKITGTEDEVKEKLSEFDASTAVQLLVRHCPAFEVPELLTQFSSLHGIKVYNSTIVRWEESAALTNANHPHMTTLFLVRVNMTHGLLPAGFQSLDFPPKLNDIEFCVTNLQSIPDDLAMKWPREGIIYIEYSQLRTIPQALVDLQPNYLAVSGNPITSLPPELFEVPNMLYLGISDTAVSELPRNVTNLSESLAKIYMVRTNISFFWSWIDAFVERSIGGIRAASSVYCNDLEKLQTGIATTFSVPYSSLLSKYLMTPTKENRDVILNAVNCSPAYSGIFYPITFDDTINAITSPPKPQRKQ